MHAVCQMPLGKGVLFSKQLREWVLARQLLVTGKHIPVLLWQIGFHVKEGILLLFDLAAYLIHGLQFFSAPGTLASAELQNRDAQMF